MPRIKTFYDELGVERDANAAAIKRAFKEIAKLYHPDRNPPEKQRWAHEKMTRLNFIVDTLLNPATRREYDGLVKRYESMPLVSRARRRPKDQYAIEREYAQVSVEIMNLEGKRSNWRLKIMIGSLGGGLAGLFHLASYLGPFSPLLQGFALISVFSFFVTLIGAVMVIMGTADYLGRREYQRRINELQQRRAFLRQRIYEAYVS